MADMKKFKLPRKHDKRYKLTERQENEIKILREEGLTLRVIADMYNISETAVHFITNPSAKKRFAEYRKTYVTKPLTKEQKAERARDLTRRKRELYERGEFNYAERKGAFQR